MIIDRSTFFGGFLGARSAVLGLRARGTILGVLEGSEQVFGGFLGAWSAFLGSRARGTI